MTPRPASPWLVPLVAALVGVTLGLTLGRPGAHPDAPTRADVLFPLTERSPALSRTETATPHRADLPLAPERRPPSEIRDRIAELLSRPDTLLSALSRLELTDLLTHLATTDAEAALGFALRLPGDDAGGSIQKAVVAAAFTAQPSETRDRIDQVGAPTSRLRLLQHLAAAMVESAPDQALDLALKEGLLRDTAGSDAIFLRWAERDPAAASQAMTRLPLLFQRRNAAAAISAAWARTQPDAALAWAQSLTPRSLREATVTAAVQQLAVADPSRALSLAGRQTGDAAQDLQSAILHTWCQRDLKGATDYALALPDGSQRDRLVAQLGGTLILDDPEQCAHLLQELGTGNAANALAATMAATWAEIDPQATLAWLAGLPASVKDAALKDSLLRLAMNSPQAAALFAEQTTATPVLADSVGFIVAALAETDAAAAFAWADKLPSDTMVLQAREAALELWTARDPAAALAAALGVNSPDRSRLVEKVAADWSRLDPKAAWEWARQQPGDLGLKCSASALTQLAASDPAAAQQTLTAWLKEAGGLPSVEKQLPGTAHPLLEPAVAVTSALARTDPAAATEWARQLPEGPVRQEVLTRHFCDWAAVAPKDAETYASTLAPGWERDWTLVSALFTYTETPGTHGEALRVAGLLADPTERARAVRLIKGSASDWTTARTTLLQAGYSAHEIDAAGN